MNRKNSKAYAVVLKIVSDLVDRDCPFYLFFDMDGDVHFIFTLHSGFPESRDVEYVLSSCDVWKVLKSHKFCFDYVR